MEKIRTVDCWEDLLWLVNKINPNKETLVLSGWFCEDINGEQMIRKLTFTIKDVEILRDKSSLKAKIKSKTTPFKIQEDNGSNT